MGKYSEILELAKVAAMQAGDYVREARKEGLHVDAKSRIDFVSDKDRISEDMIRDIVKRYYPDHKFFAEESVYGDTPEEEFRRLESFTMEDYVWVVDPIDGTVNYIRDYPQYAISIGVVHGREIVAGVIYDPFRGELFYAEKGCGAFVNGTPIHVSDVDDVGDAIINTSMPTSGMDMRRKMVKKIPDVTEAFQSMRIWNCAAISLASVAAGRSDADYEAGIHLWDMAAGIIIIREAGGFATKLNGDSCDLSQVDVIATNGRIHDATVEILNRA